MKLRGTNHRRKELIERFNFDPSKKCRTYSKGNRQKVALISAFSSEADLYILDEPTSRLDPLMEEAFQQCVIEAKTAGKSVLLSSHILSEVEKVCDKVGIIRQGKMIESGALNELRYLQRTQLVLETKEPLSDLHEVKGVHDLEQDGKEIKFQVNADQLDDVIRYVSSYGVVRLESAPPTLEDLFMRYYEGDASRASEGGEVS